jgi:glycerol-3-phosphate acyltransferase PlsY
MAVDIVLVVAGYLIGSIPWGVVVVRVARGEDIRTRGSGNIGASNVWRTYGKSLGIPVALLDVLKGFVPALAGSLLAGDWIGVLAGAAAMLGHARPVYLGFRKGGKMVATAGGVSFALAPLAAVTCLGIWLVTFALLRYASVASIVTSMALPLLCFAYGAPAPVVGFTALAAVGVIALHHQNIRRLFNGTEPRFTRRRRPRAPAGPANRRHTV